ncbi:BQ2448_3689 [Microbotryum intermedium]|uniref:BQ2448_3689 protein n=1 Tax=Microbotryum intermedium TaxID=269621 RepID=A0A238FCL8_9BASI|nr:BQ2448_3689 [Microbotryum intermedium]
MSFFLRFSATFSRSFCIVARFSCSFFFLASELPPPPAVSSTLILRPLSSDSCSLSAD